MLLSYITRTRKNQGLTSTAQWFNQLNWDKVLNQITASITLPIFNKRIQNFLILLYKSLFFSHFPSHMKNVFSLQSSSYDLHGNFILSLRKPKIMTYGLNSFPYFSAKQWNALPNFFCTIFLADFLTRLLCVDFYVMYLYVVSARAR